MQNTVNQKQGELAITAMLMASGLPDRLRERDHHVAEQPRRRARRFPAGEGQNIRRLITTSKHPIQSPHSIVADNLQTQQSLGFTDSLQHVTRKLPQRAPLQAPCPKPHTDENDH